MQFLLAFKNKRPVPGLQNDLQLFAATEELDAGVLTRQVIVSDDTAMDILGPLQGLDWRRKFFSTTCPSDHNWWSRTWTVLDWSSRPGKSIAYVSISEWLSHQSKKYI